MNRIRKRLVSLLLAALLLCSVLPLPVLAAGNPFVDVKEGKYYYEPVLWAVEKGITSGTDAPHFSPDNTCTRCQVVTFLWRAAGSPEPTRSDNPFVDVKADKFYYKAVLWAAEKEITSGTSADKFSPNDGCTRGQVVTFLWRFAGSPEPTTTTNPFSDVKSGKYYTKAVLWAADKGVTAGTSATAFSPDQTCTRAQIVTFLYRALKNQPPVDEEPLRIANQPKGDTINGGNP